MTPAELDALDKWLATELMGWHLEHLKPGPKYHAEPGYYFCDNENRVLINKKDWSPTRKIAQAFEVVEKLVERGYYLKLERMIHSDFKYLAVIS